MGSAQSRPKTGLHHTPLQATSPTICRCVQSRSAAPYKTRWRDKRNLQQTHSAHDLAALCAP
jgi:hypothetical protein